MLMCSEAGTLSSLCAYVDAQGTEAQRERLPSGDASQAVAKTKAKSPKGIPFGHKPPA
jgi:hypothetical protein